jgi:hypothetical protein
MNIIIVNNRKYTQLSGTKSGRADSKYEFSNTITI